MVDFMNSYQPPMDQQFDEQPVGTLEEYKDIEAPIVPISEIGTTVVDFGNQSILKNVENIIHMGAKKIQLVIGGGFQGSPSALASSHGKDVRQALKEKTKATGVEITGIELQPQRAPGISGFDPQRGEISEEVRHQRIEQVKDALNMLADVAGGGGVDVWANEFQRNIIDAEWAEKEKKNNKIQFYDNYEEELEDPDQAKLQKYLVDKRTGRILQESIVRTNDVIHRIKYETAEDRGLVGKKDDNGHVLKEGDFVDIGGNYIDRFSERAYEQFVPKINQHTKQYEMETVTWEDIKKETRAYNENRQANGDGPKTPEQYAFEQKMLQQKALARGQSLYYGFQLDNELASARELTQKKKNIMSIEGNMDAQQKRQWIEDNVLPLAGGRSGLPAEIKNRLLNMSPSEALGDVLDRVYKHTQGNQEMVRSYKMQEAQVDELLRNVTTPTKYAKDKVFDSWAEAGAYAYKVTKERKLDKPLYVGPEIGFAGQNYGGHPQEFIDTVKNSREKLREKLIAEGLDPSIAKEKAKQHIKGMLDTSHLTMWYKHMATKPGETDEDKLKRFKKWAHGWAKKMVEEDVVGGVQVVDSITGEHSHLPIGQGIFDMAGMIKGMKEAGFKGDIISEGHEEDIPYGQGRILTETWRAMGSPISSVAPGQREGLNTWRGIQRSYFGGQMPHSYIIGGYAPSNDWQLWSETPFE